MQLVVTDFDTLVETIRKVVHEEIHSKKKEDDLDRLLTPKEVCEKLQVSKVTLSAWTKQGRLIMQRIGGRCYYRNRDILNPIKKRK